MGVLRDRLVLADGRAGLRSNGTPVTEIIGRLEAGGSPRQADRTRRIDACRFDRRAGAGSAGRRRLAGPGLVQAKPRNPAACPGALGACLGRVFPGASHASQAGSRRRSAPDSRLLGRQPRRRPAGRRPGRAQLLSLLARHRPSPRARRRQCRLLVSQGRQASGLHAARRGRSALARPAW